MKRSLSLTTLLWRSHLLSHLGSPQKEENMEFDVGQIQVQTLSLAFGFVVTSSSLCPARGHRLQLGESARPAPALAPEIKP